MTVGQDITIANLIKNAEEWGAGSISITSRLPEGSVEWAAIIIRGKDAHELHTKWENLYDAYLDWAD